ncbi:MAG: hypothetical protein ABDH31_01790 [Chlorobiota bacterium]
MRRLLSIAVTIPICVAAFAQSPAEGHRYLIRLINGDLLEGTFLGEALIADSLPAWRFRTLIGVATIAHREIAELKPLHAAYRHSHRIFIQPTAEPVDGNSFVGLAGLFALYGGLGFQDWLSIVAAHTLLPRVSMAEQLWALNTKFTLLRTTNSISYVTIAVGAQVSSLTARHQILHLYTVASFRGERSCLSGTIFAKVAGDDILTVRAGSWGSVTFGYAAGAVGIGVGLEVRPLARRDLHFLAELWNSDIRSPSRTGLLVGVRLSNSVLALDFGVFWFGYPYAVPAANITWTPL